MPKIIFAVFFLSSCSIFHKSPKSIEIAREDTVWNEDIPVQQMAEVDPMDKMARTFCYALINGNVEDLAPLLPDVELLKRIAPAEVEGMSDVEIEIKMAKSIRERFNPNFELLQTEISTQGINKSKLSYAKYISFSEDYTRSPQPFEIILTYDAKNFSIPLTVSCTDDQCTIFEILKTTNIFSK